METKVHAQVFDPSGPTLFKVSKNERARSFWITCEMTESCDAFASGCCLRRHTLNGICKYGSKSGRVGPTRRAASFRKWIADEKQRLGDFPKSDATPCRIFKIGEYWHLPYSHMVRGVWGRGMPLESKWIKKKDMTPEVMSKIVNARPHAEFGGEITIYQKKVVPKFLEDIRRNYPELWAMVPDEKRSRAKDADHRGRKAVLATCAPGKFDGWTWDGETLSGGRVAGFLPTSGLVTILPTDGATIKITDNAQVTDKTIFVD